MRVRVSDLHMDVTIVGTFAPGAEINVYLGYQDGGVIAGKIYADGQSSGALHSIVSGNNVPPPGLPGYHQLGYTAQRGWDACTGLGTPNGVKLLALLRAS